MRVRTIAGERAWHPCLEIVLRDGEEPVVACGYSWCAGSCGLPAAVLLAVGGTPEMKMFSDMVACGRLMQDWRVEWHGTKVIMPEEFRERLMKMMWF